MPANFDEIIDRRNTSSIKYDFAAERGYPRHHIDALVHVFAVFHIQRVAFAEADF